VHQLGKQLEQLFDDQWAKKAQWVEDHTPTSGPQSPGTSPDSDEEEEDAEEEEEEEQENELSILQKQIAAMSKQVEAIQKSKEKISPPAPGKKGAAKAKAAKKDGKKAPQKPEKKAQKSKKAKVPYVTYEQKQEISDRINVLPEPRMATALSIIRDNMPNLKVFIHPISALCVSLLPSPPSLHAPSGDSHHADPATGRPRGRDRARHRRALQRGSAQAPPLRAQVRADAQRSSRASPARLRGERPTAQTQEEQAHEQDGAGGQDRGD
jgi:hypothetical protein